MSRISLVEAYDNRDVIGQLVRLREDVNELQNILKDIDPDGDLTNVVTKTGDQVIDGIKTFVGKIVADCDIIQNGAAYETHAEQVYSKNDYIVMRDDAIAGLAPGTYSGLHVRKYNGVDDARLVVDSEGTARVGDVNDEEPLLTRDEVSDMTSGNILSWDGVNKKAITSGKSVSDLNTDIAAKVSGTGNIGTDTKPVKVVDGETVAVSDDLLTVNGSQQVTAGKYFTGTSNIIGSAVDVSRRDLHLDAYNPITETIARLVISMTDTGIARMTLERWIAGLDANGVPYAASYINGTTLHEVS